MFRRLERSLEPEKGKQTMKLKTLVFIFAILISTVAASAAPPFDLDSIPPSLEPWKAWVLH
ncbi:MAG: hypothetical protein QNK40_14130, partial [Desulfobacterales bacterium]|nr:hypothetical protein [Desulfobacterales bacterium]